MVHREVCQTYKKLPMMHSDFSDAPGSNAVLVLLLAQPVVLALVGQESPLRDAIVFLNVRSLISPGTEMVLACYWMPVTFDRFQGHLSAFVH